MPLTEDIRHNDDTIRPCPHCEYDLRASTDFDRKTATCPECGKSFILVPKGPIVVRRKYVKLYAILAIVPVPIVMGLIASVDFFLINIDEAVIILFVSPAVIVSIVTSFLFGWWHVGGESNLGRVLCSLLYILLAGIINISILVGTTIFIQLISL